ncbi:MAG: hypothetical protein AVDCRST_MAG03-26 [uncultured Rubrobacteraceae bacterium]|uniref:Glyoxalase n=1 Tax=uncultured Rubrobacteraceae bacterium TaxID=349277 RepID=A0A6J4N9Y9_9ACTN|nr:MAG: hypothetical protein AVDCRST_MAG03-26 [uncultured Rubrobacteraceae bacterium]
MISSLDELAGRIGSEGLPIRWDEELAPRRRFYAEYPFGNRLAFLEGRL